MGVNILMQLFRKENNIDEHATTYTTRGCHGSTAQCGYEMRQTDAACTGCPARVDRVDSREECDYHQQ